MANETILRLIYIHGFQGDHTSFQAFPTDLHERLQMHLPPGIVLESCLYPTYKSRRPITEAAKNFIKWLSMQPPGPVILLAHSMGGLLAADVAIDDSEQSKRIVGLVAFDAPFLGMHPHVVISGISSLFPTDKGDRTKSEAELNDENIFKQVHADEVENIKGNSINGTHMDRLVSPETDQPQSLRPPLSHSSSSFSVQLDGEWEAMKSNLQPSASRSRDNLSTDSSLSIPCTVTNSYVSSSTSISNSYISSRMPSLPSSLMTKLEQATDRIVQHTDSPLLRWLRKHADDPLSAMSKWIVEHFEFGICMFDGPGLRDRYVMLECWNGSWVNFWTEVPERAMGQRLVIEREDHDDRGEGAMAINGVLPNNTTDLARYADIDENASAVDAHAQAKARKVAEKALRKERTKERKRGDGSTRPSRHFIVLPHSRDACSDRLHFGSRERWERVQIYGVEDEVGAHCGLFIRTQNLGYEQLVEQVCNLLEGWCRAMKLG